MTCLSKEYEFLCWLEKVQMASGEIRIIKRSQTELAKSYGSSPATVNGWMKLLRKNGLIETYKSKSGYIITKDGERVIRKCEELIGVTEEIEESTSSVMNRPVEENTYIDVFAGCGGLSLGLGEAGWKGLFAIEKDPMAFSTFYHNLVEENAPFRHFSHWPEWLTKEAHSIEDVLEDPEVDSNIRSYKGHVTLLAGGPPCQGFSVAGARNGNDPRNLLVFKQIELIKQLKPLFSLVENVGGFEKKFVLRPNDNTTQSVAAEAVRKISELGYSVGKVVINAADYGVPQIRKRVLLFAVSKEYGGELDAGRLLEDTLKIVAVRQRKELGLPEGRYITTGEAIGDLSSDCTIQDQEYPSFKTSDYLEPTSEYEKLMRKGLSEGEKPNCHRFNRHSEKLIALYNKAHETQPAGRLSKEFLYANGCHSNKRYVLDTSKPCSTLTTAPEELIHYSLPRVVTLREMARLQSFPDKFHFYGRYTLNGPARGVDVPRNAQIGNAIPPLAGMAIGEAIAMIKTMIDCGDERLEAYRI